MGHGKVSWATICSLGQPNKAIVPRPTRASDRTMVGHAATELLVGAQIKDRPNARLIRKCVEMRTTRSKLQSSCRRGLDAKKNKTSLRRVKCFYLTSPFIEPACS